MSPTSAALVLFICLPQGHDRHREASQMVGGAGMREICYTRCGDYFLPNLYLPKEDTPFLGKFGLLRRRYLKEHRRISYINFLTSRALQTHLTAIDKQANGLLERLATQMASARGTDENLKAADQMTWERKPD